MSYTGSRPWMVPAELAEQQPQGWGDRGRHNGDGVKHAAIPLCTIHRKYTFSIYCAKVSMERFFEFDTNKNGLKNLKISIFVHKPPESFSVVRRLRVPGWLAAKPHSGKTRTSGAGRLCDDWGKTQRELPADGSTGKCVSGRRSNRWGRDV